MKKILVSSLLALATAWCAGPASAQTQSTESQRPIDVVNAFDKMAFFDHHPTEAILKYVSPDFIEHDPHIAGGGRAGVLEYFSKGHRDWSATTTLRDTIDRTISEGDLVVIMHHVTTSPQDPGTLWIDISRVKDGLIVEHWAVGQPIPTDSKNPNTIY